MAELPKPYTLTLTEQDFDAIDFARGRYCWADALWLLLPGPNHLEEHEALEIADAFESDTDTEGGHSYFPCLDPQSDLASRLHSFLEEIV